LTKKLGEGGTGKGRRAREARELTKKLGEGGAGKGRRAREARELTKMLGEGVAGKGQKTKEARELKHVGIGNRDGSTIQEAGRRERVKEYRRVSEQRLGTCKG
jgi:hypothetical protein